MQVLNDACGTKGESDRASMSDAIMRTNEQKTC